MVPMGLYRQEKVNLKAFKGSYKKQKNLNPKLFNDQRDEHKDPKNWSEIKYVVTNPDKDLKLRANDLIFVLAKTEPGDPDKWDFYTESNKEMFNTNQNKMMAGIQDMMLNYRS